MYVQWEARNKNIACNMFVCTKIEKTLAEPHMHTFFYILSDIQRTIIFIGAQQADHFSEERDGPKTYVL